MTAAPGWAAGIVLSAARVHLGAAGLLLTGRSTPGTVVTVTLLRGGHPAPNLAPLRLKADRTGAFRVRLPILPPSLLNSRTPAATLRARTAQQTLSFTIVRPRRPACSSGRCPCST